MTDRDNQSGGSSELDRDLESTPEPKGTSGTSLPVKPVTDDPRKDSSTSDQELKKRLAQLGRLKRLGWLGSF